MTLCRMPNRHLIQLEEEVSQHHLNYNRDVVGVTPTTRIGRMNAEVLSEVRNGLRVLVIGRLRS